MNTGVGCLSFLQGIFPTQGLNLGLPHCKHILLHSLALNSHLSPNTVSNCPFQLSEQPVAASKLPGHNDPGLGPPSLLQPSLPPPFQKETNLYLQLLFFPRTMRQLPGKWLDPFLQHLLYDSLNRWKCLIISNEYNYKILYLE